MYLAHLFRLSTLLALMSFLLAGAQELKPRAANCLPRALTILAPLSTEPAVLSYCSAHFPVLPVTKTKTVTSSIHKRAAASTAGGGGFNAKEARAATPAKLSSFLAQASSLVGQVCTCFEGTRTVTTTKTVAPSATGFAKCTNFFVCPDNSAGDSLVSSDARNSNGQCGPEGSGCICLRRYLRQDGVCVSDGGCIACASDADCNGGVCVSEDTCCGYPSCIYQGASATCVNAKSAARLFRS